MNKIKVICLTNQTAFPYGEATVNRIIHIGKSIIEEGNTFVVVSSTYSKNLFNTKLFGTYEKINFYHANFKIKRPTSVFLRVFFSTLGLLNTFKILYKQKERNCCAYIYSQGTVYNIIVQIYCKILSINSIQEVNEWDYKNRKRLFKEWIYKNCMFKLSHGAFSISSSISNNIKKYSNSNFKILQIPILIDPEKFNYSDNLTKQYGLWMGLVDGYFKDVLFITKGIISAYKQNKKVKFIICGRHSETSKKTIENLLIESNIPLTTIIFKGFIDEKELRKLCASALFFIAPLWNDQKSINRFPTKMASYMICKRPIITSSIGEVSRYLNPTNSILIKPDDSLELSKKILWILNNPEDANKIGIEGYKTATKYFDFRNYSEIMSNFCKKVICLR